MSRFPQTRAALLSLMTWIVVACNALPIGGTPPPGTPSVPPSVTPAATQPTATVRPRVASTLPFCEEVPQITAPAEYFRDEPIYVANEMPDNDMRAWASTKPGFEGLWIDRDHHGWLTLAFSQDAAVRQEELEAEFPEVGAVAVHVDWTMAELEAIEERIRPLLAEIAISFGISVNKGVVSLYIGPLTPERIGAVEEHFAGERVCVGGIDPALLPPNGPQQPAGEGWRLLADADGVGPAYRTGIAFDDASYAALWTTSRLNTDRPLVDFQSEVVIWFGAVTGSSCTNIRLDDVVVNHDMAVVYAEIVNLDFGGCTDDIHSHAYVVALERPRLPSGPFAIQLSADGPPRGAPEERTVVDVDLSQPGSIAQPGEVHVDNTPLEPSYIEPGGFIEDGFPGDYRQSAHCGLEWLGPLNDVDWRTDEALGFDWVPTQWEGAVEDEMIVLRILLTTDPPRLEATANGHTVTYEATVDDAPGCD